MDKPDYITKTSYDKNWKCIGSKHVYHDKSFEQHWIDIGDNAEKYNGKLDIKQFAYEIWKVAKDKSISELEHFIIESTNIADDLAYDMCCIFIDFKGSNK